jgi:tetratricopeptide (TPR) repeat protein
MRVGPYTLLEEIARGGMGVVYRAHDPTLDREVALKVVSAEPGDPDYLERFRREAQGAARLRHPGIVAVHSAGVDEGRPYLVMDLVEGRSLTQLLKSGLPDVEPAVRMAAELADAVGYAHSQGVLHRDLKPANVLVVGDTPLLTDFGLAKVAGMTSLTETGTALGTPQYMAPEQAEGRGAEIGPATDVYGLGATLYAMLTGQAPFPSGPVMQVLTAVVNQPPVPPSRLRAGLDPRLEAICLRCLAKEPSARYASPERLARALRGCLTTGPGGAVLVGSSEGTVARALPWGVAALTSLWAVWATLGWRAAEAELGLAERAPAASPSEPALASSPTTPTPPPAPLESPAEERLSPELRRQLQLVIDRLEAGDPAGAFEAGTRAIALGPDHAKAHYRRAIAAIQLGRLEDAVRDATRAFELDPRHAASLVIRGRARTMLGDADGAWADAQAALRLRPDDGMAIALRGTLRAERGELEAALADFDRAVDDPEIGAGAWSNRGRLRIRLGDMSGVEDFERALALEPNSAECRYMYALTLLDLGRVQEGLSRLDEALGLQPNYMDALLDRGLVRSQTGDIPGATRDLSRAIALQPSVAAHFRRGTAHANAGRLGLALSDFTAALTMQPDHGLCRFNRGLAALELGDFDLAQHDLSLARQLLPSGGGEMQQVLERSLARVQRELAGAEPKRSLDEWERELRRRPRDPRLLVDVGKALAKHLRLEEALEAFERALELDATNAEAYAERAHLRMLLGDGDGCLGDYERAIELDPQNVNALTGRGMLFLQRGRFDEGFRDVEAALRLDPSYARAYHARGLGRSAQGRVEESLADLDRAIELDPDEYNYRLNRGTSLHELGRLDEAKADYEVFLAHAPDNAQAWANLGSIELGRENYVLGEACLTRSLELNPDMGLPTIKHRGWARIALGQPEGLVDLERVARESPPGPAQEQARGELERARQRFERR